MPVTKENSTTGMRQSHGPSPTYSKPDVEKIVKQLWVLLQHLGAQTSAHRQN
jgi:hypothetical protein